MKLIYGSFILIVLFCSCKTEDLNVVSDPIKVEGYRGIWYGLGQLYQYGDKYSGGLATYTAKHIPMSVYSQEVDKTFFVYGGVTDSTSNELLCMIGEYNHKNGMVSKPTVIKRKLGVDDPHDNPTLFIGEEGYIWVFISGRDITRFGYIYKSTKPHSIAKFEKIATKRFTYPQVFSTKLGYIHFFTKYTGRRELYFEGGFNFEKKIVSIKSGEENLAGHYQLSSIHDNGEKIGTFFNRHLNGNPDFRTDLYYIESEDFGINWSNVHGTRLQTPIENINSSSLVLRYSQLGKNVYLKDMDYDQNGNPICLYLISSGHEPGPKNSPYEVYISYWNGSRWVHEFLIETDHNYDTGCLIVSDNKYNVVFPSGPSVQEYAIGGEIEIWSTKVLGSNSWVKKKSLSHFRNTNNYIRSSVVFKEPFCYFGSNGNPVDQSKSNLYFGDLNGNIWLLPYDMDSSYALPVRF